MKRILEVCRHGLAIQLSTLLHAGQDLDRPPLLFPLEPRLLSVDRSPALAGLAVERLRLREIDVGRDPPPRILPADEQAAAEQWKAGAITALKDGPRSFHRFHPPL